MHQSRLNAIYQHMKARCYNPNHTSYKNYGGRGITICEEWLNQESLIIGRRVTKGWLAFQNWAYSNGYKDNLTIDRIDNDKGYSPDNCRWVSVKTQSNNRSTNHFVIYKNRKQTLTQWCEEFNLPWATIQVRLNRLHWTVEKTFETPIKRYKKKED